MAYYLYWAEDKNGGIHNFMSLINFPIGHEVLVGDPDSPDRVSATIVDKAVEEKNDED